MPSLLAVAAALPALALAQATFALRFNAPPARQRPIRPRPIADLPEATRAVLAAPLDAFGRLGFSPVTAVDGFSDPDAPFGIRACVVCVHRERGDYASVTVLTPVGSDPGALVIWLGCWTRFDTGIEVVTENTATPFLFAYPPNKRVHRLPQVADPAALYAVHRALVGRHAPGSARGVVRGDPEAEVRAIDAAGRADLAYQARVGRMAALGDGSYRNTWAGALRGVLLLHPALIGLHMSLLRRRAARLLGELGLDATPPGGASQARAA